MNQQIIYGSEYGTTRRYAEQLSQLTGIPAMDYTSAKNLDGCELVIYLGGLYAGGVKGLKHTVKRLPTGVKLILVTVGLADVTDQENIRNIQNSVRRQLPTALFDQTALFHLRGGIDYDKLSFVHKSMMAMLRKSLARKDRESLREEDRQLLDTYGSCVDFTSKESIQPIVQCALSL